MRFHSERVREAMPAETVFVTSVREPGALFESIYFYLRSEVAAFRQIQNNDSSSIEEWLDHAKLYMLAARKENPETQQFAKNPTFFDLGFFNTIEDDNYISMAVENLKSIFDLVLVADHFLESLVLLADLLCWELEDVACFTHNARTKDSGQLNAAQHSRIRNKARIWNKADAALFDYFNTSLWLQIKAYGIARMKGDVKKLKNIIDGLMSECVEEGHSVPLEKVIDPEFRKVSYKPRGVSVNSYNLREDAEDVEKCQQLIEGENYFGKIVYNHQKSRFPISKEVEDLA